MASLGITYTASSIGVSSIALALSYSASGAVSGETLSTQNVRIYTPPAAYLKDFHPVVQRWFKDVSKLLNDGIEGNEVITPVVNSAAQLDTAVTEAKAAATTATAAADSANESVQTVNQEVVIVREQITTLDARVAALEP